MRESAVGDFFINSGTLYIFRHAKPIRGAMRYVVRTCGTYYVLSAKGAVWFVYTYADGLDF